MIEMQKAEELTEEGVKSLSQIAQRINSISLVHEMLFNNDSTQNVLINDYLHKLVDSIKEAASDETKPIEFRLNIQKIYLSGSQCTSIGIITSELIYNAIKYAFENVSKPVIELTVEQIDREVYLTLRDNGKGNYSSRRGLGLRLINIFSRQLRGEVNSENKNGHIVTLKFPLDDDT